jgi:CSLREA domain-containing protein
MTKLVRGLSLVAFCFVFAAVSHAATFNVNTTNDTADANPGDGICADGSAQCSLRAAISEANALAGDDIINVPAGTYTQTLVAANEDANAGGDWDITTNITITGAGQATTILQAAATPNTATERVMEITSASAVVSISGVTLRHGNKTGAAATATRGGGIRNAGTLTMTDSTVTLNNAAGAGGVRNERTITLNNVTVSNNACNNGGATCFGGGMYNTLAALSTVTINNSTITNNTSTGPAANGFGFAAGIGIESASGFNLVITGSTISNNVGNGTGTGGANGSGLRMLPTAASTANITNSRFLNNSGAGGSSVQGSGITLFTSGTGSFTGTWDGISVSGNTGNAGGSGVFLNATGGALNVDIRNSTISGNTGGINAGGVAVTNVGGTASSTATVNFLNSTISGNTVSGSGGGLFVEQPAAGTVTVNCNFCTIAANQANIDNTGAADGGGGIFRSTAGTVNLKNSIVADNTIGTGGVGPDIAGTVNSQDFNHIENLSGATITGATGNNSTGDPQLGPLANNGGSTQTHLPAGGSPVANSIPSGTNDCGNVVNRDQRGITRPQSTGCEKGSVEIQAAAAFFSVGGRVTASTGVGVRGTLVTLSGGTLPQPLTAFSTGFGYYEFLSVPGGATYTLCVESKRYSFTPNGRQVTVNGNLNSENWVGTAAFRGSGEAIANDQ